MRLKLRCSLRFFIFTYVYQGAQGTSFGTGDREGNEPPESLFTVLDGDGNIYHAFMEVCNIVFSGTPRQMIKFRMRTLGLNLARCPVNVKEKVRKVRPQLAGFKVISLIAKRDVAVLEAYHQSCAPNERSKFFEPCSPNLQESSAHVEKNRPRSALLKVKRDFSPKVRGANSQLSLLSMPLVKMYLSKETNLPWRQ